MVATIDHDRVASAFRAPLILIRKRLYRVSRWIRDEWRLNAAIRQLRRLNDDYLDDIGIKRRHLDLRNEILMKRLRYGDRNPQVISERSSRAINGTQDALAARNEV